MSSVDAVTPSNLVVLRGTIGNEARVRELPSGSVVTQFDVTTVADGANASVPVALYDQALAGAVGDQVVVVGHVRRRFFRAGGVTQSRTEVVASSVIKSTRRRTVDKALAAAAQSIVERVD